MAVVKIDDGLKDEIIRFINLNHIEYPTIKSFVDKAIKEKLKREIR